VIRSSSLAPLASVNLMTKVGPAANRAIEACRAANNGNMPQREQALLPYFATPQEGADFVEFLEAQKAAGSH
jgi:hypothetical protein